MIHCYIYYPIRVTRTSHYEHPPSTSQIQVMVDTSPLQSTDCHELSPKKGGKHGGQTTSTRYTASYGTNTPRYQSRRTSSLPSGSPDLGRHNGLANNTTATTSEEKARLFRKVMFPTALNTHHNPPAPKSRGSPSPQPRSNGPTSRQHQASPDKIPLLCLQNAYRAGPECFNQLCAALGTTPSAGEKQPPSSVRRWANPTTRGQKPTAQ